jgi:hypothetical protein
VNSDAFLFAVGLAANMICAPIGFAIGARKGRGAAGFYLGLLLGVFGLWVATHLVASPEMQATRIPSVQLLPDQKPGAQVGAWWPDPLGRFAQRYHDGVFWTEHVVGSDGVQGVDSPLKTKPGAWWPDPLGRSKLRWHDGSKWTGHVLNTEGAAGFDPPSKAA